jgi:toxin YoeB
MGKFGVKIEDLAKFHINKHIKSGNKANIKRIQKILEELSENPYEGIGNPEPLKYELTGFWSRRINSKDRLIYFVEEDIVIVYVISAIGHYLDK